MKNELEIRMANREDIDTIGHLARQIWPVAYKEIIAPEQLEYMLRLIYSPGALREQMKQQHQFLIAELEKAPVGFASYSAIGDEGLFKLHKLYVLPTIHGKGVGKALLDFVTEEIVAMGATILRLNMNRNNKAKTFYERNGFNIIKEEDIDIGNNYFMNDYVMEKRLT
jgi:diamine N-acetyltransferase